MSELLKKISSYNIFNYLLPGILFAVLGEELSDFTFIHDDIILGLFIYYFEGLVISRIGSLGLEPIARRLGIVSFASYDDFVEASKDDDKLEVLSETNNMYRTLTALAICLLLLKGVDAAATTIVDRDAVVIVSLILLAGLFLLSYRKQSQYIKKRIEHNQKV